MKKIIILSFIQLYSLLGMGQTTILPGDKSIDFSLLQSESYTMEYLTLQDGIYAPIGNYKTDIAINNQKYEVTTRLSFHNSNTVFKDHFVCDAHNFKPISSLSERDDRMLSLNFSEVITGTFQDNKNGKKTKIKEQSTADYFDIAIYPHIIRSLALTNGYKAVIPVFDYEAQSANQRFCKVIINKVKSDVYRSTYTGEHKVWEVGVYEESTKQNYIYSIDKESRKIWKIMLIPQQGNTIILRNSESDFNPLKNTFNKEATLKLITRGTAVINGQAFARDNKNGGALQGMAVLNVNKKQFAAKGTTVVLIPYTDFFREWLKENEARNKKLLPPLPLPEGAAECIIEQTVYDENGHFEFANLMPGDYFLSTKFLYTHDATITEEVGRTDTYINGAYVGSNSITESYNFTVDAKANVHKVVSINTEGEKVSVKLKKTL